MRAVILGAVAAVSATPALAHPGSHEGGTPSQLLHHVLTDPHHLPNVAVAAGFGLGFAAFGAWRLVRYARAGRRG